MRQIKFRAWDKGRKEFISGGMILIAALCGSNPKNSPIYLDYKPCDACKLPSNHARRQGNADHYKDRFVLQQFTGFKDQHGKEWWETDIIETVNDDDDDKTKAVIVFKDGAFRKSYKGWDKTLPMPIIDKLDLEMFTVIGNTWENKNLY